MIYCEGRYCSRRDKCAYHEHFEWKYPRQYLDMSTEGRGSIGSDNRGNLLSHHEFYCGDRAERYINYKALGWREGEIYKNSEGTICDEVCLTCQYKTLCFSILESAGMVFSPGDRIRFNCEDIKKNPNEYRNSLIYKGWPEELLPAYYEDNIDKDNKCESEYGTAKSVIENIYEPIKRMIELSTGVEMMTMYNKLKNHIGHNIVCVSYGDKNNPDDISIECEDCNEVLISTETSTETLDNRDEERLTSYDNQRIEQAIRTLLQYQDEINEMYSDMKLDRSEIERMFTTLHYVHGNITK